MERITVLIMSWERAWYLWPSLDSIYRNTRSPVDFVLMDNNSQDPNVARIIRAFDRRGMFREIVWSPTNDPHIVQKTIRRLMPTLGAYLGFVESDVMIRRGQRCWVETMVSIMEQHPKLAMLGSQIDKTDFIDPDVVADGNPLSDTLVKTLKARSPERQSYVPPGQLASPHNPPGRLQMLRTAALATTGMFTDSVLHRKLTSLGWDTKITGDVVHRHLSLLHYYDYPEYDADGRDAFMKGVAAGST